MTQKLRDNAYNLVLAVALIVVTILVTRAMNNDDLVEEIRGMRTDIKALAETMNAGLTKSQIADAIHDQQIKSLQENK